MNLHSLITLPDWFYYFGTSNAEGLHRICDLCADAGLSRLYLRTHEGGMADYPSKVSPVLVGREVYDKTGSYLTYPQSYYRYYLQLDFRKWNPLEVAHRAAEQSGIEMALWYTIMEDDHGGSFASPFMLENKQWWCTTRQGESISGCLEFWFEEVRRYKLGILREILASKPSRILLDLVRRNGTPSADGDGYFRYGFNPKMTEAFARQSGLNAHKLEPNTPDWHRWVDFVSRPYTELMIEACRMCRENGTRVDLMVWPVHQKSWMAIDLEKILDSGLVDAVQVASHTYAGSPAEVRRQLDAIRPQVKDRPVEVIPTISGYEGVTASGLDAYFAELDRQKVQSVALHESEELLRNRVSERFRALKFGVPHYKRVLRSRMMREVDWDQAPKISGFLRAYNAEALEADQVTEIQSVYTAEVLHVRVRCAERHVAGLLPVPRWPSDNYNVRQLRARTWWNPMQSVHLFVSPAQLLNDYFHFVLDPSGKPDQEMRLDELWSGAWSNGVKIETDGWVAQFVIPFSTMGFEPRKGMRIAIQAVRVQAQPLQVTQLNLAGTNVINPDEFGFLELE
jgi:hypothetical protein